MFRWFTFKKQKTNNNNNNHTKTCHDISKVMRSWRDKWAKSDRDEVTQSQLKPKPECTTSECKRPKHPSAVLPDLLSLYLLFHCYCYFYRCYYDCFINITFRVILIILNITIDILIDDIMCHISGKNNAPMNMENFDSLFVWKEQNNNKIENNKLNFKTRH